jgi:hypothetical protein
VRDPLYPRRRRPAWLLPAAIAVGAIAAIAGGAFLGVALTGPRDTAQGDATPSASTVGTAGPTPTVELSTEQTSSPEPTPVALPVIPNRAIAEITVDSVALWSEPNESSLAFGELGTGARLFIIGEPGERDGQRWYRIAYVEGPSSGFDCNLSCGPSLGYVATPASGDDPWLEVLDVTCPASPLTTDQLLDLLPLERLHCYGRSELTVTGPLDEFVNESSGTSTPEWLADNPPRTTGIGSFSIHVAPDFDGELPDPGSMVRMVGHFEDPAAATCRVDYTLLPDAPSTAHIVLGCRTRFVMTDVEVLAAP